MVSTTIIGDGRVGRALTIALAPTQFDVVSLVSRHADSSCAAGIEPEPIEKALKRGSELVIISTQDSEISDSVADVIRLGGSFKVALHTSGALSSEVLSPLRHSGCSVGSVHPLVSISEREAGAKMLSGSNFCVEGDDAAVAVANSLVMALKGRSFTVETDKKPLYHASAVLTSGAVVSLLDVAAGLLVRCGLASDEALSILLPLLDSTVANLKGSTPEAALTGPYVRADVETIVRDLRALSEFGRPIDREIFVALGKISLEIAERGGERPGRNEIAEILDIAEQPR